MAAALLYTIKLKKRFANLNNRKISNQKIRLKNFQKRQLSRKINLICLFIFKIRIIVKHGKRKVSNFNRQEPGVNSKIKKRPNSYKKPVA